MQTTAELLALSRKGDEQAIGDLILRNKSLVKSIVRKYFLIGSDMDDLMQEGMVGLYKAILSYRDDMGAKFESYAKVCISRQVFNAIKQANNQRNQALNNSIMIGGQGELDNDGDDEDNTIVLALETENPESIAIKKERLQKFYDSINTLLNDKDYKILQMYLDGLSYNEIAQNLKLSTKNVDNALTRIRGKLRKENING